MGQLGNQMFIIAATTSFALDNQAVAVFPDLVDKTEDNIPTNYNHVFFRVNTESPPNPLRFRHVESLFSFQLIPFRGSMSLTGWFQTEKYFKHHKKEIIELFKPKPSIVEYLIEKHPQVLTHPQTVAIHFRDYTAEDPQHKVYPLCDLEYYMKAIMSFPEDALFVVFSNNINWCKDNFAHIEREFYFVENQAHYLDLFLMSMCKNNIIANSSFSWWGAYLNQNPDKIVIAPFRWFTKMFMVNDNKDIKDLIPSEWIQL